MKTKIKLHFRKDHFQCILPKEIRRKLNVKVGDLMLLKVRNEFFIKKLQEGYLFSLPLYISSKLKETELQVLKVSSQEEASTRAWKPFLNEEIADMKYFIPQKTIYDHPIFAIDYHNFLILWYPVGGGVKCIKMKRYVDIENLFEFIGFLWGDGSTENVRSLRLTNSELSTLKATIRFFESLGIPKDAWKMQIIYSNIKQLSNLEEKGIIESWSRNLDFPIKNIKSVSWSKSVKSINNLGSARIFIDNAILFEVFVNGILQWCIKNIDSLDSKISSFLIRGLMAAEGGVDLYHNYSIRRVEVSFDGTSNESVLFSKLFSNVNVDITGLDMKHNRFNIDGWSNFNILNQMNVFKLNESKDRLFRYGFSNHRMTKSSMPIKLT